MNRVWCPRPDSNRHGFLHTPLKRARLPIPPLGQLKDQEIPRLPFASLRVARDDAFAYFFAGALLAAPLITDDRGCACMTASVSEVITNRTKNAVVSLCRSVVAPRAPNAVCDPPAPNAPARSAPCPCCTRTTRIRHGLRLTCN